MIRSARRTTLITVVVLCGGCLLGGLLGGRARAESGSLDRRLQTFSHILALVQEHYVGEAEPDALIKDAIQGMLRTLDPHSNLLDKDAYNEMRDEQRGKFYGLGIQITKRGPDKPLTIVAPIDGTPANRAGLTAGDIISRIEGEETMGLTVQQAVRRLKGDKGTKVTITIQRPGTREPFDVTLIRDEIPTRSIPVAYMLRPDIGFIRISNFTSTTARELDEAIEQLRERGMTRLLIDLRGNPGGLLDQAVQVSERFVPEGKLIVYTRGRIPGSDQDYLAQDGATLRLPLVVLVDHSSASASEIVSGAIQDHDRGLVVGETTFGKGLVQRVIPLSDGGALAITTAKYYTPSGRLIQRDYSDLDDYFFDTEEQLAQEERSLESRELRRTDSGRAVYGGGGITPDYLVRAERASPLVGRLIRENLFFDFAVRYLNRHPEIEEFTADEAVLRELRQFVETRKVIVTFEELEAEREILDLQLRAQIARLRHGPEEESRTLAEGDAQVQKALTVFDEAAELARLGEKSRRRAERGAEVSGSGPSI